MKNKKISYALGLIVFFVTLSSYSSVDAKTYIADTCNFSEVRDLINTAAPNDTIRIAAGVCTWDQQLVITKGLKLVGENGNATKIMSDYGGNYLISYKPSDYSANQMLVISQIDFDFQSNSGGVILEYSNNDMTAQTRIAIGNNIFRNANTQALMINGYRGVAFNNTFIGSSYPIRFASGPSDKWWDNWEGIVFGKKDNNFYFEDNFFECYDILCDCQFGNRYLFRYNEIVSLKPSGAYPLLDMHGNAGQYWSCFGGEIYGNDIYVQGDGGQILDQRGGKALVFYNKINGKNVGIKMREEYSDSDNPTSNSQPQHVSDSYNWSNWKTSPANYVTAYLSQNTGDYKIAENVDFWNYNPNYNGTTEIGVGCGNALPSTCTEGDGFWLTSQSCTDLDGMVGPEPSHPIDGALYRCSNSKQWENYFVPYEYPHPLRDEGIPRPSAPENLRVVTHSPL